MAEAATGDGSDAPRNCRRLRKPPCCESARSRRRSQGWSGRCTTQPRQRTKRRRPWRTTPRSCGAALAEKEQSLAKLDQAKLHESMHQAMEQIHATVGHDGTSIAQVQQRIEARLERARSLGELAVAVDAAGREPIREVERALATIDAQSRLEGMRGQLGLSPRAIEAAPR